MHVATDIGTRRLSLALAAALGLFCSVEVWSQDGSGQPAQTDEGSAVRAGLPVQDGTPTGLQDVPVEAPNDRAADDAAAEAASAPDTSLVSIAVEPAQPESAPVGTLRTVQVTITLPAGWAVSALSIDERFHVELVDDTALPPDPATTAVTHVLTVRAFRVGEHRVPGVVVRGVDDQGRTFTAQSEAFSVLVSSLTANESEPVPAPSEGLVPIRIPDRRPLYAAIAVAAALLGALGWALWRRSVRNAAPPPPPPPPRPADEVALERLTALETGGMLDRGEHLLFHHELSEILRRFVGDTFGFDGVERTTSEVRSEMLGRNESAARWEPRTTSLLADTDMVKFARWAPPETTSRRLLHETRELVLDIAARAEPVATQTVPSDDVPPPPADPLPPVPDSQEDR